MCRVVTSSVFPEGNQARDVSAASGNGYKRGLAGAYQWAAPAAILPPPPQPPNFALSRSTHGRLFCGFAQRGSYVIYGTALPDRAIVIRKAVLDRASEAVHHTERGLRSSQCGTMEHQSFSTWDSGECCRFLIPHFPP